MPFTVDKGAGRYTIKHKLCANAPAGTNWTQPRAVPWTGVPKNASTFQSPRQNNGCSGVSTQRRGRSLSGSPFWQRSNSCQSMADQQPGDMSNILRRPGRRLSPLAVKRASTFDTGHHALLLAVAVWGNGLFAGFTGG